VICGQQATAPLNHVDRGDSLFATSEPHSWSGVRGAQNRLLFGETTDSKRLLIA